MQELLERRESCAAERIIDQVMQNLKDSVAEIGSAAALPKYWSTHNAQASQWNTVKSNILLAIQTTHLEHKNNKATYDAKAQVCE